MTTTNDASTTAPSATGSSGYVFADEPTAGATHHGRLVEILSATLDEFTTWRLRPHVSSTSRCLEVAAGAGSIARWLAQRAHLVVATDTNIEHVGQHAGAYPNLVVRRHDITTDPLTDSFDLIHARLVLAHLPQRHDLIGKLAAALGPGGVLVVEEFQPSWDWCLLDAPNPAEASRLFTTYQQALTRVLASAGNDTTWGRNAHKAMRAHGLTQVDVQLWARSWQGGQPGCLLPYTAAAQLRPKLVAAGMTDNDIDAFRALLTDPQLMIHANLTVSTLARRP